MVRYVHYYSNIGSYLKNVNKIDSNYLAFKL